MLFFEVRLPLKKLLVTTLTETLAHTSRKYVVVQGMSLPKSSKKHKLFWLHSSIFAALEYSLKMLIFAVFLPAREPLVATSSEMRAVTLPKDIVKQVMKISKV